MFNPDALNNNDKGSENPEDRAWQEAAKNIEAAGGIPVPVKGAQEKSIGGSQVKQEASQLVEELSQKTAGEKYISEYQTREAKIRGTEIERGAAFRFERGQIYKGYKILRGEIKGAKDRGEDTTSKKELLRQMREQAKVLEKNLDQLERQYHENVKVVDVETEFGKFSVPVVELDLMKDVKPEEDKRTPYFILGQIATNFHQSACLSMALALDGHKVFVPMQPEQPAVKKPDNFGEILKQQGSLKPHAKLARGVIEKIGLKEFNLVGYSMGATSALELATDPELKGLNDLTVIEPLGIEQKGFLKLAKEFAFNQGILKTLPSSEQRIKAFLQGSEAGQGKLGLLLRTADILSKKQFDAEKLKAINPKGRFQICVGTNSPVLNEKMVEGVLKETEILRQEKNPNAAPLEFYKVAGADHEFALSNALGLFRLMAAEKPTQSVTGVKLEDLENSAMARILKEI